MEQVQKRAALSFNNFYRQTDKQTKDTQNSVQLSSRVNINVHIKVGKEKTVFDLIRMSFNITQLGDKSFFLIRC